MHDTVLHSECIFPFLYCAPAYAERGIRYFKICLFFQTPISYRLGLKEF